MATADPFAAPEAAKAKAPKDERKAAYNEAQASLRAMFPEEWEEQYGKALEARGLEHKPRLTPEEREAKEEAERKAKAAEQVAALVEKFGPDVLGEYAPETADEGSEG